MGIFWRSARDFNASEVCFNKAVEGLIRGMAAEISLNYDNEYDDKMPLEELLAQVKRRVYKDRKYVADNNYFMEEEPEDEESSPKNNVLKLIRKNKRNKKAIIYYTNPLKDFIPFSTSMLARFI